MTTRDIIPPAVCSGCGEYGAWYSENPQVVSTGSGWGHGARPWMLLTGPNGWGDGAYGHEDGGGSGSGSGRYGLTDDLDGDGFGDEEMTEQEFLCSGRRYWLQAVPWEPESEQDTESSQAAAPITIPHRFPVK